jgi:hypothetical protein
MTDDDIMQAAREAGPLTQGPFDKWCQRFAALVAVHKAEVITAEAYRCGHAAGAAAEREACAELEAEAVIEALNEALAQPPLPAQEQQQARVDVITVTLMREGINKHRARELADHFVNFTLTPPLPVQEPVSMRMPKVGDKVICLEDESLGEVVSLTAGGSPDIKFDDGSHGTYLLREFAELFGYVASPLPVQPEPVTWDKPSASFNEWWNGDYEDPANPFEKDSHGYWAWEGWQAALRSKNT